jgi:hypothetical protein
MKLTEVTFTIEGMTPLMTCNPQKMAQQNGSGGRGTKRIPTPEEDAELGTYRSPDGYLGVPALAVRNAVITAAGAYKHKARSLRGMVTHIMVEPQDLLLLHDAKGKPITEYKIDTRRAVLGTTGKKVAIMVSRPIIPDWRTSFTFIVDEELLPREAQELFETLLNDAGTRIGIGAYRPEKMGWFGRFKVVEA